MKPVAFRDAQSRYEITAAYGPWRTGGCWWSADAWDAEEWDVLAVKTTAQRSPACSPVLVRAMPGVWRRSMTDRDLRRAQRTLAGNPCLPP